MTVDREISTLLLDLANDFKIEAVLQREMPTSQMASTSVASQLARTCSFVLSAVEWMRTRVPRWEAVASSLPSRLSASAASPDECACTNLVRLTSYSSTRTCATAVHQGSTQHVETAHWLSV